MQFFIEMWPYDNFEFETLCLEQAYLIKFFYNHIHPSYKKCLLKHLVKLWIRNIRNDFLNVQVGPKMKDLFVRLLSHRMLESTFFGPVAKNRDLVPRDSDWFRGQFHQRSTGSFYTSRFNPSHWHMV